MHTKNRDPGAKSRGGTLGPFGVGSEQRQHCGFGGVGMGLEQAWRAELDCEDRKDIGLPSVGGSTQKDDKRAGGEDPSWAWEGQVWLGKGAGKEGGERAHKEPLSSLGARTALLQVVC